MSTRLTSLNVTVLSLGGTNILGYWRSIDANLGISTEEGKAGSDRYQKEIPTKKKLEFSVDNMLVSSTVRQTNCNISVFTVGGIDYLGELESGSISITTTTEDGSGDADLWEYPNETGTEVQINVSKFVTTSPQMMALAAVSGSFTALAVQVAITLGGATLSFPMILKAASHKVALGKLQMEDVTFGLNGTPTTATGDTTVVDILTGDAVVAVSYTYRDAGTDGSYSCNALVTATNISWGNKQITTVKHDLACQGAPTFVAAIT